MNATRHNPCFSYQIVNPNFSEPSDRRRWAAWCTSACAALAWGGTVEAIEQPNLIVIMTDDQGYADVGFHGSTEIPTPNIDRIAENGVVFSSGYVTGSVCGPSRAGFITGRYPQRFGFERNVPYRPDDSRSGLPLAEETLAEALSRAGYRCGIIGKWHLGSHETLQPLARGFHEFFGFPGGGKRYFPEDLTIRDGVDASSEADSYRTWIVRDGIPVRTEKYLTDEFSDEAVHFIHRNKDQAFFLFLAYNAPHGPLQAPESYRDRFPHIEDPSRRTYAAMVSAVDDGVGRLLDTVEEFELEESTLIFFLSDNGGPTQRNASNNDPLRGGKGTIWEGGFRVPFAAQWKGTIPAGMVFDAPIISMDIFGTIVGQAQIPIHSKRPLDGVDLIPYLTGAKSGVPHDVLYFRRFDRSEWAVREGDFKMVILDSQQPAQLYNLSEDIGEQDDIATGHARIVRDLDARRAAWNEELIDPVFDGLFFPRRR